MKNKNKANKLHESVMKEIYKIKKESKSRKLNERAQMNIKNIENMELNELLSSLKEVLDYDYNGDFEYFDIVTEIDGNKAFIDIRSRDDISFFDGWSVDDILDISVESAVNDHGFSKDDFKPVRDGILKEKEMIEKEIIPAIARQWGFRQIKEDIEEEESDDISFKRASREKPTVVDMIEDNLFRTGSTWLLRHGLKTHWFDDKEIIRERNSYSKDQAEWDVDVDWYKIYLSLINEEDADIAKYVADTFGLESEFTKDVKPKPGYDFVYKIEIPNYILDRDAIEFIVKEDIDSSLFEKSKGVDSARDKAAKRIAKKNASVAKK